MGFAHDTVGWASMVNRHLPRAEPATLQAQACAGDGVSNSSIP